MGLDFRHGYGFVSRSTEKFSPYILVSLYRNRQIFRQINGNGMKIAGQMLDLTRV